jgi:hypothetical protein
MRRPDYDASRSDSNNQKKYKQENSFWVSVTDLGSIKYEKGVRNSYDLNNTVSQADYDTADNFDDFIKSTQILL